MTTKYEVQSVGRSREFDDRTAAVAYAETLGSASLIQWHVEPNLPHRLPELVYRSVGLDVFENGAWRFVPIH